MFPVLKKKSGLIIKLLVFSNILLLLAGILFFDFYKKRKINQYNDLFDKKQEEITNIESLFSKYYHVNEKFVFNKEKNKILKTSKKDYILKKINTNLYFSKTVGKSTAYLDIYDENLILTTATGLFFKINFRELNNNIITPIKIDSNILKFFNNEKYFLKSYYGVKDILIDKDSLFVSFSNEVSENCFNTGVLKAELNREKLIFKKFFDHQECASKKTSKYRTFQMGQAGGRIIKYMNDYLLSHGSYSEFDEVQDDNSLLGKILLINKNGNLKKIFSKGHRNPQGLNLFKKKIIFQTEHGPQGGDEINIVEEDSNYGWPIASYGSHYKGQKDMNKIYPLPAPHKKFKEPIIYFKNSIAISQILEVPKIFTNEIEDSLFLASMKVNKEYGKKINLYQLKYKDNNIIIHDLIPVGERIRDLVYDKRNNQIIMFLDTSASIGILSVD